MTLLVVENLNKNFGGVVAAFVAASGAPVAA
jgi:hypothetical protein